MQQTQQTSIQFDFHAFREMRGEIDVGCWADWMTSQPDWRTSDGDSIHSPLEKEFQVEWLSSFSECLFNGHTQDSSTWGALLGNRNYKTKYFNSVSHHHHQHNHHHQHFRRGTFNTRMDINANTFNCKLIRVFLFMHSRGETHTHAATEEVGHKRKKNLN